MVVLNHHLPGFAPAQPGEHARHHNLSQLRSLAPTRDRIDYVGTYPISSPQLGEQVNVLRSTEGHA
jgi:hypothetical protein